MPRTYGRPVAHSGDRQQSTYALGRKAVIHQHAPETWGRPPDHASDRRQAPVHVGNRWNASGSCQYEREGHRHVLVKGGSPMACTGDR